MADSNITPSPLAGADAMNNVAASDGKGTVGSVPTETLTLEQINELLGKDFKDIGSAQKGIKETFNFVGQRKQDIMNELKTTIQPQPVPSNASANDDLAKEVKAMKNDLWFERNSQYKAVRPLIERLASNGNLEETVNSQEFKDIFTKAQGYDETQKSKTVLQSNPKIKTTTNKLSAALQASNTGKHEEAQREATNAVMEMYGL